MATHTPEEIAHEERRYLRSSSSSASSAVQIGVIYARPHL
jgi:hypothetical protein